MTRFLAGKVRWKPHTAQWRDEDSKEGVSLS